MGEGFLLPESFRGNERDRNEHGLFPSLSVLPPTHQGSPFLSFVKKLGTREEEADDSGAGASEVSLPRLHDSYGECIQTKPAKVQKPTWTEELQPLCGFLSPVAEIWPLYTWVPGAQVGSRSHPCSELPTVAPSSVRSG